MTEAPPPTAAQILAARARLALDRRMNLTSPGWVRELAAKEAARADGAPRTRAALHPVTSRHTDRALARVPDEPMHGGDVRALQAELLALGYHEIGAVDGVFGARTEKAVRRFQTDYDVLNDGVFGRVSRRVLNFLRQNGVTGDNPATVQQRHQISFIVRSQHTGLLIIDLVSDGVERLAARGEQIERAKGELGASLEHRIQELTGMQSWLLTGPEFRNEADELASFANNIDAELYIAASVVSLSEEGPGCRVFYFGTSDETFSHVGRPLAEIIHERVVAEGVPDRGLGAENSVLFEQAHVPTVRVEFANVAHPADRAALRLGEPYLDRVAAGIAAGIRDFYLLGQPAAENVAANSTFAQLALRRGPAAAG